MKQIIYVLSIFFVSCTNIQNCIIVNHSDSQVKNIIFSNGFDTVCHKKLEPTGKISLLLNFEKKSPKGDGCYFIEFTQKDTLRHRSFGYYSNGCANDEPDTIEIKNDTFLIN